ncbi:hypothetical protein NY486_16065, partial [Enterobacter hormaechei]|nr:hypothetical protein [Enterobacter hormaechei]
YEPPSSLNEAPDLCEADPNCRNPCVRGDRRSVSHDYGQYGYVVKVGAEVKSACKGCWIKSGGVPTREVPAVLGSPRNLAALDKAALSLAREFKRNTDAARLRAGV